LRGEAHAHQRGHGGGRAGDPREVVAADPGPERAPGAAGGGRPVVSRRRGEAAREEARFLRGDAGVDGRATEEKQDAAEVEKGRAREQFLRGKTWLGRELLTWLLYRSESGEPVIELDGAPVTVLLTDRLVLRGVADDVLEMTVRGAM